MVNKSSIFHSLAYYSFRWLKYDPDGTNPVPLDPNDPRVTIFAQGNLQVGTASPQMSISGATKPAVVGETDEGLYQCIAENSYGSALSKKVNASIACEYPIFMDLLLIKSEKVKSGSVEGTCMQQGRNFCTSELLIILVDQLFLKRLTLVFARYLILHL